VGLETHAIAGRKAGAKRSFLSGPENELFYRNYRLEKRMSTNLPQVLANPDTAASYQTVFDALGKAYWDAPDQASKDQIHAAQQSIGDILTQLDEQDLANNTEAFTQLQSKIKAANDALKVIQDQISQITKDVGTAGAVVAAVSKVLSLFG
jgi:hypothetical protein